MIEVKGADQLARLSKALKDAGNKELQKELSKGISASTKPFIASVRRAADRLPGRLAARVARTPMRTVKRPSGVQVRAKSPYGIGLMDKGVVWHPLFGNRNFWFKESVTPGLWSEPVKEHEPVARRDVIKAMDRVADKIEKAP